MPRKQLFISHSANATDLASFLHSWIGLVIPVVKTWCSTDPNCLPQGADFPKNVVKAAEESHCCISVLTEKSKDRNWINFEAGLFFGKNRPTFAILCGNLDYRKLSSDNHPLSLLGLNYTSPTHQSMLDFMISLNNTLGEDSVDDSFLRKSFESNWPDFEREYSRLYSENTNSINKLIAGLTD
ncbi:hypothetical protein GSF04_08150 [Pseudoalteromonas sp. A22]|uniref:hypothetical protein n=1 Tax=Pseudoalteromonas sp. A22 TaxID=327511 RepID=UPI001BAAB83D|nr:hypothetical protein [Pseudoalteromonas sp. A22]QUI62487.1 hypothetical protein GSF04_08150 [Pseudoalteromonas sp. A22]